MERKQQAKQRRLKELGIDYDFTPLVRENDDIMKWYIPPMLQQNTLSLSVPHINHHTAVRLDE